MRVGWLPPRLRLAPLTHGGAYLISTPKLGIVLMSPYQLDILKCVSKYLNPLYTHEYYPILINEYKLTESDIKRYTREVENHWKRLSTVRHRISNLLKSGPCYFYTFTFTDDILNSTNEQTRRKYISRFLKGSNYVANIDFGKNTQREHYHAVADVLFEDYPYGFFNRKEIRLQFNDLGECTTTRRLSKYVAKLSFHALKDTTKHSKLLYSRKLFNVAFTDKLDVKYSDTEYEKILDIGIEPLELL